MNIQTTSLGTPKAKPSSPSHRTASQRHTTAPEDSVTLGSQDQATSWRGVARVVGGGLGAFGATLITGLDPGVGGVSNALVCGLGMGIAGAAVAGGGTSQGSAEDRMSAALGSIMLGGVGLVAGTVLGAQGFAWPALAATGGAVVVSGLAAALVK